MSAVKVATKVKRCQALTVLVYSCAALLTMVQAVEYWRRYQRTPTVTTYRVEERWSFPAPKITLCRTPSFKIGPNSNFGKLNLSSTTKALGSSGEWRHTLFRNDDEEFYNYFLSRCFTFHPNVTLGVGMDFSGYFLRVNPPPSEFENVTVFWYVYIHKDLGWGSMYLKSSYTKIKIKEGTSNQVILSGKEINQVHTTAYPCESREGYSSDECQDTCLSKEALKRTQLSCRLPSMNLSLPVCEDILEEIVPLAMTIDSAAKSFLMNCSCLSPCQNFRYSVDLQPPDDYSFSKAARLSINVPENTVEVLYESEAYDFIQMVGKFGGCLGLFLGISLVSIYEFLDQYIRYFFTRWNANHADLRGPLRRPLGEILLMDGRPGALKPPGLRAMHTDCEELRCDHCDNRSSSQSVALEMRGTFADGRITEFAQNDNVSRSHPVDCSSGLQGGELFYIVEYTSGESQGNSQRRLMSASRTGDYLPPSYEEAQSLPPLSLSATPISTAQQSTGRSSGVPAAPGTQSELPPSYEDLICDNVGIKPLRIDIQSALPGRR
ncbi:unnamed protein product [Darwinula stevensoni]|uniref:Uncharacterized protein n=1 Tax=Darwinula stevensoni TaxID=69355 RepID=A0A7R9A5U6_9CRUS|nr:unnamed protein product [Darwinula stevensoni]CAG0892734.1 unnamed protein product [Darwinula stevensoni]